MYEGMSLQLDPPPKHLLYTNARPEAFAQLTREILGRLGYGILTADELQRLDRDAVAPRPAIEMLVLDEHRLNDPIEIPELTRANSLPTILLTGRAGIRESQPDIVAGVKRPAGLHELYRILQTQFEESPRSTPRVDVDLDVVCSRGDKSWTAAVLSISENGCLLQSSEEVPLGSRVNMTLNLPEAGTLQLEAESAYQLVPNLGMVFSAIEPRVREAIGAYVLNTLATA